MSRKTDSRDELADVLDELADTRVPGRRRLTDRIGGRRASRVARPVAPGRATSTARVAAAGSRPFPHREAIRAAFGRDEFEDVDVVVGDEAREPLRAFGARALTAGDTVLFGREPDLFTAAHEAAHVVQQRAGWVASGSVGQRGDSHEAHADEVASRVVTGESAEELLPATGAGGVLAVQAAPEDEASAVRARGSERRVITFITGSGDAFYRHATQYWEGEGRTDHLVRNAGSLEQILGYLRSEACRALQEEHPWAEINIVSHGNPDGQMDMRLREESRGRITPEALGEAIEAPEGGEDAFRGLDEEIVDAQTNVNILGCRLGENRRMLEYIARAFGGNDESRPSVYAPRHLQAFDSRGEEYLYEAFAIVVPYDSEHPVAEAELRRRLIARYGDPERDSSLPDFRRDPLHRTISRTELVYTFTTGAMPPLDESDRAGHEAFLQQRQPSLAAQASWEVSVTRRWQTDEAEIEVHYRAGDEHFDWDGTDPTPRTEHEQRVYLRSQEPDLMNRNHWSFQLTGEEPSTRRQTTSRLECHGERMEIRVQRELVDPETGQGRWSPSRESSHYGAVHPPGWQRPPAPSEEPQAEGRESQEESDG